MSSERNSVGTFTPEHEVQAMNKAIRDMGTQSPMDLLAERLADAEARIKELEARPAIAKGVVTFKSLEKVAGAIGDGTSKAMDALLARVKALEAEHKELLKMLAKAGAER